MIFWVHRVKVHVLLILPVYFIPLKVTCVAHSCGTRFISVGQCCARASGTGQAKVTCREYFCSRNSLDSSERDTLDQF